MHSGIGQRQCGSMNSIAVYRRNVSKNLHSTTANLKAPDVDTNPLEFQIQPIQVDATFRAVLDLLIWITQHVMHSPQA